MRTFILGILLGLVGGVSLGLFEPSKSLIQTQYERHFLANQSVELPLRLAENEAALGSDQLLSYGVEPCFPRATDQPVEARPWLQRAVNAVGLVAREELPASPDLQAYPGLVKIEGIRSILGTEREHCAATRISEHWFLTAAHCIIDLDIRTARPTYDVIAVTPSADVNSAETQIVGLTGAVCHAAYGMNRQQYPNDIALFYLADVSAFEAVQIAELETPEHALIPGDLSQTYISGWGKNGGTRYLQGGPVTMIEAGEAVLIGQRIGPRGPNVGDSGAPLYVETETGPLVLGVLSQVTQDSNLDGDRSIYIRSRSVYDWIQRTMLICEQEGRYVCAPPTTPTPTEN